jgi:thermitase
MYQKVLKFGLVFIFLFVTVGGIAQASSTGKKIDLDNYEYVPDQLLVSFKPSLGREHANQVLTELGVERIRNLEQVGAEVLRLPPGLSVEKALEIFSKRAEVLYAEPNYILTLAGNLEAEVVDQWGLNKVEAPLAWQQLPGQTPITIAVVDTGVDPNNPDLLGNIWEDPVEIAGDGIDNDGNGYIDDTWGWDYVNNDNDPMDDQMHGTAVSSVAAGNHDGQGVAGVCPWCKVMAVKVLSAEGSGSLDVAASGIIYAADQGAKIINLSMAAPVGMQTLENAVNYAWDAGALVVAAAGNDGAETSIYPAAYQNAMSVASTDIDDHHSCFSNYSDGYVSVSAPGSNVTFAYLFGGLKAGSGTSLAAPHVAGLAGLLLSQNPARTNQDLWTLIEESANDLGPVGRDAFFGTGRINALRAVTGNTTPTPPPDEDYVLVDDPTAYAHARKLARSSDGTLHNVWYDKIDGAYSIQYASSSDNGLTWSPPETIFSSTAESYHPAITLDKDTLYVVFPTKSGTTAYHIEFTAKPISGGSWSVPVSIMGGSYNAVRPDIYLDPSNNMLHVVASSLDDSKFVYYRSSIDGGASWASIKSVDFIYYTRYASVYAYGDNVYIGTRMTNGMPLIPTFYLSMMRSLDGGVNWQDRMLFDTHTALTSSEYGLSLTGFEETLFFLYEHNSQIRFGKSTNGVNWDRVIADTNASKWPTITTAPDGKAWLAWVSEGGTVMLQRYLGGQINLSSSYVPTEELYAGKFPNFKEGTSYNRVEWVSTDCSGAPFGLFSDFLDEGSNTPPFAFVDAPASGQAGAPVQFDATASYDPDGDPLTFSWDFGDGNLGSGPTPSHTYQTAGMFTVALTLSDGNGGIDTAAVNVDVQQGANQPPNAVIGGPYSGSEDGPINFDGSASSDPDEDPLTYTWDFGDGTVGSGETPSHTYAYGGNFTVTLTVADGISGEDTAETTVSVQEVNDQPVAVHNGPFTAETGQPIQFDASGSYDADNLDSTPTNDQTLSYLWDFGDGSTSSEVSPTHA